MVLVLAILSNLLFDNVHCMKNLQFLLGCVVNKTQFNKNLLHLNGSEASHSFVQVDLCRGV